MLDIPEDPDKKPENKDTTPDDEAITRLLREALREKLIETKKYPETTQLRKALISSMLEFMSCFKVIGYDVDGEYISLTCTRTDMHKHALTHAYLDEFSKIVGSKM